MRIGNMIFISRTEIKCTQTLPGPRNMALIHLNIKFENIGEIYKKQSNEVIDEKRWHNVDAYPSGCSRNILVKIFHEKCSTHQ